MNNNNISFIFSKLPADIINYEILPFDKHFVIRKGKLIAINEIKKNDYRYKLLKQITMNYSGFYKIS